MVAAEGAAVLRAPRPGGPEEARYRLLAGVPPVDDGFLEQLRVREDAAVAVVMGPGGVGDDHHAAERSDQLPVVSRLELHPTGTTSVDVETGGGDGLHVRSLWLRAAPPGGSAHWARAPLRPP